MPHIDSFQENGYTKEEMKMVWETKKIFSDPEIQVNPTCVRVPVFYGHQKPSILKQKQKYPAQKREKFYPHPRISN